MSRKRKKPLPLIEEAPVLIQLIDRLPDGREERTTGIWPWPLPSKAEFSAMVAKGLSRYEDHPNWHGEMLERAVLSRDGHVLVEVSLKQEAAE